jgi:glycosyltransferase involved in cell wall biosynthesis
MSYNLTAAAAATGLHKTTILRAVKSGRVSGTKNELGKWQIEPAELHRVYQPAAGNGAGARAPQCYAAPDPENSISLVTAATTTGPRRPSSTSSVSGGTARIISRGRWLSCRDQKRRETFLSQGDLREKATVNGMTESHPSPTVVSENSIVAIIPLYNGALWIEEAIRSVLAQTLQPDEIIVVDDGSTDGGSGSAIVERMRKLHPQIKLLRKPNGGQSSARNFGVRHSNSRYIALIDQDDRWYRDHLSDLMRAARRHKGLPLGWVYSDFDDIDDRGEMVRRSFVDHVVNPKRDVCTILSQGMIIQPSATLIAREAFEAVGGFDEQLSGYEDDDLFLRIFRVNYDNVFVPHCTSQWRIHDSSAGASNRTDDSLRYYITKLLAAFPDDRWRGHFFARDLIAPRFVKIWLSMYVRASRYGNKGKMREYATAALELAKLMRPKQRIFYSLFLQILRSKAFIALNIPESPLWMPACRIVHVALR